MKKYISLLLATAATIACTKVALEDNSPIESLPQDGNTENVQGEPSGEKIIISLAETKVSLDENGYYQFDGDEVIYVQASSTKAVAKLQNSAAKPTTFTGVFNGLLGETSEIFDFYYNCTDENANVVTDENGNVVVVKVQNGQPWLAATGVPGNRSKSSKYSYELSGVKLKQLDGYVCLALNSNYPCTVDFHSLSAEIPAATQDKTIAGMSVTAGKPYFVNINTDTDGEFKGGFYLAVNKTGETGTMYTSYATATTISKNTTIKIKDFTPLSITGELSGFNTSYSIYTDSSNANRVAEANSVSNDYMSRGSLTLRIAGISNSLLSRVYLKSITIRSSDGVSIGNTDSQPAWENKTYTWSFNDATYNHPWGQLTVTATAVFDTPAGQITATVPEQTRYITGLPYRAPSEIKFNDSSYKWTSGMTNVSISADKVHLEGAAFVGPKAYSPAFKVPKETSVNINCSVTKSSAGSSRYTFELKRSNGSQNDVTYVSEKGTTTEYTISNASLTKEYCKLYAFYSYTSTLNYMEITKMNITYR